MDERALVGLLKKLSLHFENNNLTSSTIYDNLPVDYKEKMIKAIVAFELEVTEMDNVHKLSQNRDEKSYDNIVQQLKQQDGDAKEIGELMEKEKNKSSNETKFFIWVYSFIMSCSNPTHIQKAPLGDGGGGGVFDKEGHRGCRGLMPENTIPP